LLIIFECLIEMKRTPQNEILSWYEKHARKLVWRNSRDPYVIWLSEIIMQQTRIEQGTPYFNRFYKSFPKIIDFANASEDEILNLWQGLGYYSRARNMHHTAKAIVDNYHGQFPSTYKELISLKGIGDYTASAILSICFNKPYAVLDGNVFRILSRYFAIDDDINTSSAKKIFKEKADELLDKNQPGDFNQAMMDIGALICTPNKPDCAQCPLHAACIARKENTQNLFPVKRKKAKLRKRYLHYFLIRSGSGFFIRQRLGKDVWLKLYELPLIEKDTDERLSLQEVNMSFYSKFDHIKKHSQVRHLLSHQELHISFYEVVSRQSEIEAYEYILLSEKEKYAFPKPIVDFLAFLI
jgi:A/G-specific adenine glycosylase